MITLVELKGDKNKFMVIIEDDFGKIHVLKVGDSRYQDYTIHHDKERRRRYIQRHNREDFANYFKKGFWARWLLWNKKTIKKSINFICNKFKLSINLFNPYTHTGQH